METFGIDVTPYYADNVLYLKEVRFGIPGGKWSEFERSQVYRQLVDYVHSLKTQDIVR